MPLPKENRYTLADALTWEEQERIELIDGTAVMMAPPSRVHQEIAAELTRQIGNYLDGKKCRVYPAPFAVRLFEKAGDRPEDVDTLVEPDLSVVCDPGKLDDLGCVVNSAIRDAIRTGGEDSAAVRQFVRSHLLDLDGKTLHVAAQDLREMFLPAPMTEAEKREWDELLEQIETRLRALKEGQSQ